jgi:hypothetical protein
VCCSQLKYVGRTNKDGTVRHDSCAILCCPCALTLRRTRAAGEQAVKPRQVTGFSVYVKEHFARVMADMQACGEAHNTKDVMRELAAQYKAQKNTQPDPAGSAGGLKWAGGAEEAEEVSREQDGAGVGVLDSVLRSVVDLTV